MADWVLKGSIKGPQGDPGADAQLPEGGTTGDFLQKKSDGTGWFNSEGLLRASYIGNLQQLGDAGQSLEIHNVSVTSNGYVAGASTDNPPEDGAFVYADDKNSSHLGHNRVGVLNGIPYVDLDTTDATGENGHLAADGRYSYVDDIEAADAAEEQGEALTIPTGAAVKQYVADHAGDALPEGGTDGQVLTSDGAGGAAWESVPQPDLSGLLKADFSDLTELDPSNVDISTLSPGTYRLASYFNEDTGANDTMFPDAIMGTPNTRLCILNVYGGFSDTNRKYLELFVIYTVSQSSERYYAVTSGSGTIPSKGSWSRDDVTLSNIITKSDTTRAVTGKAVADYVAANASTVKTASNQDFCAYMGMEYNAEDWS